MVSLKLFGKDKDDRPRGRAERRSGYDRRSGRDRRSSPSAARHERRRQTRDLYKNDLDRHLWSWPTEADEPGREKRKRKRKTRRRTVAGIVASTIGAVGAAGLSIVLLRSLGGDDRPPDPEHAEADLDEADFED
jgi:hypothetical protein